jgi:hypothetical protein
VNALIASTTDAMISLLLQLATGSICYRKAPSEHPLEATVVKQRFLVFVLAGWEAPRTRALHEAGANSRSRAPGEIGTVSGTIAQTC